VSARCCQEKKKVSALKKKGQCPVFFQSDRWLLCVCMCVTHHVCYTHTHTHTHTRHSTLSDNACLLAHREYTSFFPFPKSFAGPLPVPKRHVLSIVSN
jgi:hypothetical protein